MHAHALAPDACSIAGIHSSNLSSVAIANYNVNTKGKLKQGEEEETATCSFMLRYCLTVNDVV